ncbi:protein shisa-5-like [Mizuhopecten yessoensis]|uniref:Uncharacterized protein n=1 Tax=Mizuhopecten yessoensis TaxID=6573 RepID=A0A210QCS1_MIZYE|nr:protein shisa-5-like [Mizuhopecten yessoensis]OWF46538.1 hypothetical protein KP79_PYT01404 [Mizuhopecten yessoensis]
MITWTISIFVGLCLLVDSVEGGECCKAHYGRFSNDEMWCGDYCCSAGVGYYCCDNILFQVDSLERDDLCSDYFSENVWAPILIALGSLGAVIGCCFCCYRCCCRSNTRIGGAVVMAPAGGPSVTVVNTTNTMTQQPPPMMTSHAGYNQGQQQNY